MNARQYAQGTTVSADRSKAEIERTLQRFGADQFGYVIDETRGAVIAFRIGGRAVRISLPMPSPDDPTIRLTPSGRERSAATVREEFDKEVRRRWRSLAAVIKAKLVAVSDGISSIEREFLSDLVTDDGRTVLDRIRPSLEAGGALEIMPWAEGRDSRSRG